MECKGFSASVNMDQEDSKTFENQEPATSPIPVISKPIKMDGGFTAWTQVLVGFLLMFSSWGLINSFGVFQEYYSLSPALGTPSAISWIGSLQSFILLLLGTFSGRLVDAGYGRSMTMVGSFLIVFSLVCISLSGGERFRPSGKASLVYYQILLSQGICGGVGMGLVFIPSISIPATYFQERRALAVGIVTSGAAIGGIVFPIIFEALLAKLDFRWVVRVIALVALVTLAVACILIRPRTDLPKKKKAPMIELGAFKERAYLTLVLGMFASFAGVYVVYFYIENRAKAANVNLRGLRPYYLISLLNVRGVFGRIIPNHLADKSYLIFIHSICVTLTGVLIFAWPFITSLAGVVVFCLIYGFFSGAFISLPPASVGSTMVDMSRFGARFGMAVTCNAFGVLIGPPIAGAIIRSGGGYVHAAIFAGIVVVFGGVCLAVAGFFNPGAVNKFRKALARSN